MYLKGFTYCQGGETLFIFFDSLSLGSVIFVLNSRAPKRNLIKTPKTQSFYSQSFHWVQFRGFDSRKNTKDNAN